MDNNKCAYIAEADTCRIIWLNTINMVLRNFVNNSKEKTTIRCFHLRYIWHNNTVAQGNTG